MSADAWACPFCPHPGEGHTVEAQGCERPDCLCFYLPRKPAETQTQNP